MEVDAILNKKYQALIEYLLQREKVIIAFSGGVDSTTLLEAALREKGVEVMALLITSELLSKEEETYARDFLQKNKIPHREVALKVLDNPDVRDNPIDRCYHCKGEIFRAIGTVAKEEDFPHILEGSNADDRYDYRPGKKALEEMGIESPLQELDFTKDEIRRLAKSFDLPVWDRPSSPCLATRFPTGVPLEEKNLRSLEDAERDLRSMGLKDLRLRMHEETARLEVPLKDIAFCTEEENRHRIVDIIKSTGARFISLDLEGYRTGSMNISTEE